MDSAGKLFVADQGNNRISIGTRLLPTLTGTVSGSDVVVSWPSLFTGFAVQTNADLGNAGGWQSAAFSIRDDGTNKSITVPSPTDTLFFRLKSN